MSSQSDIENEDPILRTVEAQTRHVDHISTFYQDHEKLIPEDVDNLRPSFACFEDQSFHPADVSASVIRNMGNEFAALADDDTEKISTYLRIRPSSKHINGESFNSDVYSIEGHNILKIRGNQVVKKSNPYADETKFKFSRIFGPECTQSTVFEECVQPILERFFLGENCLIFSYGATNSGKTYTMQGYGTQFGIVPRTLDQVYNMLEDRLYTAGNIKPNLFNAVQSLSDSDTKALEDVKQRVLKEVRYKSVEMNSFRASFGASGAVSNFSCSSGSLNEKVVHINSIPLTTHQQYPSRTDLYAVWVNFIEIYNERVYDLLELPLRGKKRKELKLLADKEGRVYIKDLTELPANSAEEAYQLFLAGKNNLQFAATQANQNSSRSHSFFNIRVVAVGVAERTAYPKRVFQMSFCDLAGIERVSQTGNFGVRLKESGNINQSLVVLLKCIRAMRDKQQSKHNEILSFRESKLTRLFKGYLTATTHTRMIVNINPDPDMFESSFHVLQNSAVASEVITYRRVEPPVRDTAFSRRVRDSIGLLNQIRDDLEATFEESLNESVEDYVAATVVAKDKVPGESMKDKNIRLEMENAALKQEMRNIEDRIRAEMCTQFAAIQQEYENDVKKREKEVSAARTNLSDRRLSIAFRMMNLTKEDKQVGTSPGNFSNSPVTANEGHDEPFTPPNNRTVNYRQEWQKEKQTVTIQSQKIEELNEIITHLQRSLEERLHAIARLETEKKEREQLMDNRISDLKHMLQLKEEELNRVKQEDPTKCEDGNLQRIQNLLDQIETLNEKVANKDSELQDALNTCVDYHQKLEEANNKLTLMSVDYNKLHKEHQDLAEENDIMHLSVDDLSTKILQRDREIERLTKMVEHDDFQSTKSTRRNPRK